MSSQSSQSAHLLYKYAYEYACVQTLRGYDECGAKSVPKHRSVGKFPTVVLKEPTNDGKHERRHA